MVIKARIAGEINDDNDSDGGHDVVGTGCVWPILLR